MERHIAGSTLWSEWDGLNYDPENSTSTVFFTTGHIDIDDDFIRTSLAIALQQSGASESRGEAFKSLNYATVQQGYAGYVEEDLAACDEHGETFYGDEVTDLRAVTWVEVDTRG